MVNVISEVSKEAIFDLLNQGKRIDHRMFTEYRDITIKTDYISKANGSALISIGNTTVIAGVKAQLSTPFSNSPDEGILIVNTETLALANKNFEHGPPNKFTVEISRVVDRTIREAPLIDLKQLCVVENSKVWKLHVDIYIIDFDGNMMDAAALAAICALLTTKIPTASCVNDEITIDEDTQMNLPIKNKCMITTVTKINNQLIFDPTYDEEQLMDSSLSVGFREDGSLCAMQKCGLNVMSMAEVKKTIKLAEIKSKEFFEIINQLK